MLTGGAGRSKLHGSIYVIMNTRMTPEFRFVEAQLPTTLSRTVSTLLKAHAKATVLTTIEFARSTGIGFNMTHIDMELPKDLKPGFNTEYMGAVYALGYSRAQAGNFWQKTISLHLRRARQLQAAPCCSPAGMVIAPQEAPFHL
jgi:hypothetical protein